MNHLRFTSFLLAALVICGVDAHGMIGLSREDLEKVYGVVQEESKSVYGDDYMDLLFVAKTTSDGNNVIIAATMLRGRCHAVSYLKRDPQERPIPLAPEELRNQMVASAKNAGGQWQQVGPKEWKSEPGPGVQGGLKAYWPKPELFQIFTRELLEKTGRTW